MFSTLKGTGSSSETLETLITFVWCDTQKIYNENIYNPSVGPIKIYRSINSRIYLMIRGYYKPLAKFGKKAM
jgi:hypothetical protein